MFSTFYCQGSEQKFTILNYDESQSNARYRVVVNDCQVGVLHLQRVDTKDTPVTHLSLCPGLLETEVLELLARSPSTTLAFSTFLIEKGAEEIVYRSRHCQLLYSTEDAGPELCQECRELQHSLRLQVEEEDDRASRDLDMKGGFDNNQDEVKGKVGEFCDTVLKILKDEPLDDYPLCENFPTTNMFAMERELPSEPGPGPKKKRKPRKVETDANGEPVQKVKKKKLKKKFSCPGCTETFFYQLNMVKHASKKHGLYLPVPLKPGMTRCPFCAEIFNEDSPFFLAHLKYSHPQEREGAAYKEIVERISVAKYICSTCGKDFLSNRALEDHMVEVHSTHVLALPCDVCGKCFKSRNTLENHVKKVHQSTPEDHLCVECGKIFNCKRNLVLHFERHHSNKEFICRECEGVFRCRKDLREHIKRRHTDREKSVRCEQCEKEFYSTVALKKHISNVHEKLKPFYCEVCVFRCARLSNLNVHRKTHNKTRITKAMLINMVENDEHPFYTKEDLSMLSSSVAD